MKHLPVYQHRNEVITALKQNQILIVESPTGSGKTTQLPIILHEAGYTQSGMIGITQPRRIATLSVCDFISRQLQASVGDFVGYKMRFEDVTSDATKIKIMTDGTLLQELKHDPLLQRYSVLMVDEAHERSLTIDFILGLVKDILPQRPDLRLLISSATIRTEIFSKYFFSAPVISIQTDNFPVQVIYRPKRSTVNSPVKSAGKKNARHQSEEQAEQIRDLILQQDQPNDVLVFLPGEANIKACMAALLPHEKQYGIYTLPLYARLSKEEQQRIFEEAPPSGNGRCRKVILSTNIAETSLTIEGIGIVIDTGLAKLSHFDSYNQHAELRESGISKASAEQRKGRAGRLGPGTCYRLYSRSDFQAMRAFTQEEIQRTDLTEVLLRMAELGIRKFEDFDFITKPKPDDILNAIDSLVQLGALQDRQLTEIGKQMCYFPLLPKHSRILIESVHIGCIHPACVITAFLSCSSPFLLPHGEEREAREAHARFMGKYGDFEFYLKIFQHYSKAGDATEEFCQRYYLDSRAMQELQRVSEQLKEIIRSIFGDIPIPEPKIEGARYHEEYARACLTGLQLCIKEDKQTRRRPVYRSLNARNIIIHPGSSMFQKSPKYILAGEIMRTSQTYARCACFLEPAWIEHKKHGHSASPPKPKTYLSGHWQVEEQQLLWLGQRFELLNHHNLLRNAQRKKKTVPHIALSYETLLKIGTLPDAPPEIGINLYFQEKFVTKGLMLSDLYQIFSWHGWDYWQRELPAIRKLQSKMRPSYDGRMKKLLLKHLDLLFTPCEEGIYGLDTDAASKFWFCPFSHFGEMLQTTSLALEALADTFAPLPDNLQIWLERCDTLY